MTSLGAHLYQPHYKTLRLTKTPSDGSGYFEGLASTWDIDRDGERFAFGAWSDSLFDWQKAASMPPLFWSHKNKEPNDIIGRVVSMKETVDGLWVAGQLDLTNDRAVAIYERMLAGVLDTMSVGFLYDLKHREDGVTVIDRAELLEVSLTPVPSNSRALVSVVKSRKPHDLNDPGYWNDVLDGVQFTKAYTGPAPDPDAVDRFVTETRQMMVEEKLAEAEQAAWEERMGVNMVLDLAPVRVDARMRPVTS
jgi:HK97 family phage prohead protease